MLDQRFETRLSETEAGSLMRDGVRFRYLAIVGLVVSLGCVSAKAATANEVLPACKLYLSVVDRQGTVSQFDIPHLMDAGGMLECRIEHG
jgi:hypothetical protein